MRQSETGSLQRSENITASREIDPSKNEKERTNEKSSLHKTPDLTHDLKARNMVTSDNRSVS